jgi:hypothetical protein
VTLERVFTILAFLLVLAAAICLWRNNTSVAFVIAASSAVVWFLGYRFRLRAQFPQDDDDDEEVLDGDEEHESDPRNDTN